MQFVALKDEWKPQTKTNSTFHMYVLESLNLAEFKLHH